jgi:hypothetical protein
VIDLNELLPGPEPVRDSWRWATVTQASPLRVRLDGDADPLDLTPDTLTTDLLVADRVYCHLAGGRVVVFGRSARA